MSQQREINAAIMLTFLGAAFWDDIATETITIGELGREIRLPFATVSRHLRYLGAGERKGYPGLGLVTTTQHPEDGRNKLVHLTETGRALRDRIVALL